MEGKREGKEGVWPLSSAPRSASVSLTKIYRSTINQPKTTPVTLTQKARSAPLAVFVGTIEWMSINCGDSHGHSNTFVSSDSNAVLTTTIRFRFRFRFNQSINQSINQFNSNLAAREPYNKWYAVEI